jgi:hypothetical protein
VSTPSIAHFGTTLIEPPPPPGVAQSDIPVTGDVARTLQFLEVLGLEPAVRNLYDGVGRQFIWRRGDPRDSDYLEIDTFTSYRAVSRPATAGPRVGDTIFRVTHADPQRVYQTWRARGLAVPVGRFEAEADFRAGRRAEILVRGPQGQWFELTQSVSDRVLNHAVYIWTDPERVAAVAASYADTFGLDPAEPDTDGSGSDFHGIARVRRLRRASPGITIGLLTPLSGNAVAPRWSTDIFLEAGYSHFRLGTFDKQATRARTQTAFPDGGDVSFVYFEDSYLELVEIGPDDPAR